MQEASARAELGALLQERGRLAEAEQEVSRALALRRAARGDEHPEVGWSLSQLAWIVHQRGDRERSVALCEEAIELAGRRALAATGSGTPARADLTLLLRQTGRIAEARELLENAARALASGYPEPHVERIDVLVNLGEILFLEGEPERATEVVHEALAMARVLYPDGHPQLAFCLNSLGLLERRAGRHDGARAAYGEAVALLRRFFPDGHPRAVILLNNLGALETDLQQAAAAGAAFVDSLAIADRLLTADHPDRLDALLGLGRVRLYLQDDPAAAEPLLVEALRAARTGAAEPRKLATAESRLGTCLARRGPSAAAEELLGAGHRRLAETLGAGDPLTLWAAFGFAQVLEEWGRLAESERWHRESLASAVAALPADDPVLVKLRLATGQFHARQGRHHEAVLLFQAALAASREPVVSTVLRFNLGLALLQLGCYQEAEPVLAQAAREIEAQPSPPPDLVAIVNRALAAVRAGNLPAPGVR